MPSTPFITVKKDTPYPPRLTLKKTTWIKIGTNKIVI